MRSTPRREKVVNVETGVDGMSGSFRWCTVVNDPREEAEVVL